MSCGSFFGVVWGKEVVFCERREKKKKTTEERYIWGVVITSLDWPCRKAWLLSDAQEGKHMQVSMWWLLPGSERKTGRNTPSNVENGQ